MFFIEKHLINKAILSLQLEVEAFIFKIFIKNRIFRKILITKKEIRFITGTNFNTLTVNVVWGHNITHYS